MLSLILIIFFFFFFIKKTISIFILKSKDSIVLNYLDLNRYGTGLTRQMLGIRISQRPLPQKP